MRSIVAMFNYQNEMIGWIENNSQGGLRLSALMGLGKTRGISAIVDRLTNNEERRSIDKECVEVVFDETY